MKNSLVASIATTAFTMSSTLLFTGAAQAQDAPQAQSAPQAAADSATAEGQRSSLEEVVVTATRRAENIQDVPIAVTSVSGAELDNAGITSLDGLSLVVPNLQVTTYFGSVVPTIRGVGTSDASIGQEASTATYVDGVYIASPTATIFSFNNIERIEVLKGPQGTLFGRNATAGLIHVITRDPTHTPEMNASVSYGNYDTFGATLYASAGLTEDAAVDFALFYSDQNDGYGRNITTGTPVYTDRELSLRSKLVLTPGDSTTIRLIADYTRQNGDMGQVRQYLPGAVGPDGVTTYTGNFYDTTGAVDPAAFVRTWGVAANIESDFENFSVTSITAYRDFYSHRISDGDFTPANVLGLDIDVQNETFTQEVRLASLPESDIQWILGAFYMNGTQAYAGDRGLTIIGSGAGPAGAISILSDIETESYAAFAEATLPLSGNINFTAGTRWSQDRRERSGSTNVLAPTTTIGATLPFTILNVVPAVPASVEFSDVNYRAILDYHFSSDAMAYASYNRGFKAGGFNYTAGTPAYAPETLDAYEIGFKMDLFEQLRLNTAAFYYDYKNLQLPVLLGPSVVTVNATNAIVKGLEVEADLAISAYVSLRGSISLLDTEFGSFTNAPCYIPRSTGGDTVVVCDATGNRLTRAPSVQFSLAPRISIPTSIGEFTFNAAYSYTSEIFWDVENALSQEGYSLVNAQAGWTAPEGRFGINLFARNLFDERYVSLALPSGLGDTFTAAPPRTYGVELTMRY